MRRRALLLAGWLALAGAPARAQVGDGATLTFAPLGAPVGGAVTARAEGLPPNVRVALVWHSGAGQWRVEDGAFLGIVAPPTARTWTTATTDAAGRLALRLRVPEDYGYIHDVEIVAAAAGTLLATQGFTVVPHLEIAPRSGPPGTPIAIRMTGLGYRFYESVWHLLYDGAHTGWLSAVTTHGTATVTIPASGALGLHTLQTLEGPSFAYLNGEQSPNFQPLIPRLFAGTFRIVPGAAHAPLATTRARAARLRPAVTAAAAAGAGAAIATDYGSGPVGSPLRVAGRGWPPNAPVRLSWETLVGNRLSGNGWSPQQRPLATVTADAGGAFTLALQTPDDLGGPHRLIASANEAAAESTYTIVPSTLPVTPARVAPGSALTIHLKGVGYTETGNTYTLDLDNGYVGYGCGFNSRGDVTIHLRAPGAPGPHFIDLYPTIYRGQMLGPGSPPIGSTAFGSYFLLPMLNVADHPGEPYPAFHLVFDVR